MHTEAEYETWFVVRSALYASQKTIHALIWDASYTVPTTDIQCMQSSMSVLSIMQVSSEPMEQDDEAHQQVLSLDVVPKEGGDLGP